MAEYLAAVAVRTTPAYQSTAGAPVVTVEPAPGWRAVAEELIPTAYAVWALPPEEDSKWAKAGWADNSVLLVSQLSKGVDSAAVMRCAFTDSRRMPEWYELGSDIGDYEGWPSAQITGAYSVAGLTFWSCTRYVLVEYDAGPFLLQLTVTTRVDASRDGSAIAGSLSIQARAEEPKPGTQTSSALVEPDTDANESGGISFHI
ncbi:LpqN/LpqT family lipoprotein [Nocardia sp. CA2R105]|uniref:LpqN/LpqT family lipoprotein n=1 Tax=Nocardia coffeae TaxID=2873381 RepID=UPI001CA6F9C2|nr:LpqN/LpqT family lipoprotein [Nocardia coffeae]MBY8860811.1 LpqN/LpqT family lipoprotein [Nocardia coffeae]